MSHRTGLSVCLTCLRFRGTWGKQEQRCRCQRRNETRKTNPSGEHVSSLSLCKLCARGTTSTGTRWSWLACDTCRRVNKTVGEVVGGYRTGFLPFGAHSLMNGVFAKFEDTDAESVDRFAEAFVELVGEWRSLGKWRDAEGRRLAESAGKTPKEQATVPLDEWEELFPPGTGASIDAMCRYVGAPLPDHPDLEHLTTAQLEFLYSF